MTITIDRADLETVMMGAKTLAAQIADGTAKVAGDTAVLTLLASTLVDFDPRFEIMQGIWTRLVTAELQNPRRSCPRAV